MKIKGTVQRMAALACALAVAVSLSVSAHAATGTGADRAKAAAYTDAGITESQVTSVDVLKSYHTGQGNAYKLVFRTASAKYIYRLDAAGAVISGTRVDFYSDGQKGHHEHHSQAGATGGVSRGNSLRLTAQEALDAALAHCGLEDGSFVSQEVELEREDGWYHYEVELEVYGEGEYDCTVDADTGAISARKAVSGKESGGRTAADISFAAALKAAMADSGYAPEAIRQLEIELERDDGRLVYEIELETGSGQYECTISAATGRILDREFDD